MKNLRNRVQLIGNLAADPEVKNLESGKLMAKLSIATSDSYINNTGDKIEDTQWHNVVAWGKNADLAGKYLAKGQQVCIEGKLNHRSYEDKNGDTKYVTEVIVNDFLFLKN
tara:strand:- start:353 stop:685 length:333 start_codon:yes stop_codon:yes gene_type:complete